VASGSLGVVGQVSQVTLEVTSRQEGEAGGGCAPGTARGWRRLRELLVYTGHLDVVEMRPAWLAPSLTDSAATDRRHTRGCHVSQGLPNGGIARCQGNAQLTDQSATRGNVL